MAANALPTWDRRGGLSLSEAKSIIDTLEAAPAWFGRDTIREFSPRPAEREDPVAGGHVPQAPKSLGDLLREKIAATREKVASEDPEKPEHSLWLNVYPPGPGYCQVVANRSRAEADNYAVCNRIACLHITFKEGEGL